MFCGGGRELKYHFFHHNLTNWITNKKYTNYECRILINLLLMHRNATVQI